MSRSSVTAVDFLPFSKLTQASLAPRVRSLLEGTYQAAWPLVDAAVEKALDELDQELFKQADKAGNVNDQNRSFEGLREFRRRRADFVAAFRDLVQRGMLALVDQRLLDEAPPPLRSRSQAISELTLVDPLELEQELALGEIAARADIRANASLNALAYRFGVIAGTGPLEHEALPLGPHKLCNALRAAARKFDVIVAHRVLLFRHLDKSFFTDPVAFYEVLNRYLIEHRVFPHLHLAPRKPPLPMPAAAPAPAPAPTPEPADVESSAAAEAPTPMGPMGPVAPTPAAQPPFRSQDYGAAPPAAAPVPGLPAEFRDSPAAQAFSQVVEAAAQEQARAQAQHHAAVGETAMDTQFFATLRELLAGRRGSAGPGDSDTQRPVADTRDVQSILTVLQSQPAAPVMVGGKWVNRGVGHIKQDMLNQMRSLSDDGTAPRLREEDSDTIDLVGFLFDHLLADYRPNSLSHSLMSRLQVPLLKVALKDKSFFTRRNHPARQLLNTIAETSSYWVEDEDQDRPVIEKMRVVVDRVIKEFDDDVTVFDRLFDDLSKHMGGLQKKAEVAERRHVEAAKGREKLDLARAAAQEAVQQRIFEREPPAAVKALLESTWTDAIALSLLREGIDSATTRERLAMVDQITGLFAPGRTLTERQHALDDLRGPLEDGLGAVGFHEDAISKACDDIARLIEQHAAHSPEVTPSPAIDQLVRQNPRLGGDSRTTTPTPTPEATPATPAPAGASTILQNLRKVEPLPLGPKERDMIERVKQLPFGTWFEFTMNQQGEKMRRKLCWFSPVTGRCLFVNPRGGKAEERMIDQLARDLLRGNAHVVEESHEKLIDRAWKSIVGMLKGVGIGNKDAVHAPA
jgi:hypothetical protein